MSEQPLSEEKKLENKASELEKRNKRRFQIELEFIQCLANPWYLNNLAQKEYFEDPVFLNYLEYLKYWKRPEYAKFIVYPHALHFLDLLQNPQFREHLKNYDVATEIHSKQYYHWLKWRHVEGGNVEGGNAGGRNVGGGNTGGGNIGEGSGQEDIENVNGVLK
ncbi:SOH1-domain-containing protein [Rhizophagus irregularis]|uniref:Mediator of RNA polymerase II transcription subunit 31 n=3 Tax=Rhizophagus irregularis TaxID=588596 RepID=A0A2I1GNY5_9GLOM|nr:mediator of RNA polymerase II transcription subunit 31 [Rhizophagus irregularis DAOM 181602=DAOM 197198]EXX54698.1 Soh1p [Rhizophagus irregularis DAOM 197198w]PKC04659.1 SOH1-domain-containing protein [Rhizophagus irregularis]PKK79044.1 SOH1-domain-containing protein [Rhizophagus irregularis]PKY23499.1 SOH1-domain-containing protein [Rhizophagus irregularis]PKY48362.1 SOH1-domain-containing protein [Rhizophagus irregularis]|eukprot:XP_025186563.1 mediator of RNA polymerase II transcription subunit 31 [Rhizophagus irregularis DAOM 181602=DAOM 197198]